MNVFPFNTDNTKGVSASYGYDPSVSVIKTTDTTEGNLKLISNAMLSAAEDVTTNYYNKFFLGDCSTNDSKFTVSTNKNIYPKYIPTYLKLRNLDKYLVNDITTESLSISGTDKNYSNSHFELILLSDTRASIRQYNYDSSNPKIKYLTLNNVAFSDEDNALIISDGVSGVSVTFQDGVDPGTKIADEDTQVFDYVYDDGLGLISFFKNLSGNADASTQSFILSAREEFGLTSGGSDLSAFNVQGAVDTGTITNSTLFNNFTTFEIRKTAFSPSVLGLNDTWVSYVSSITDNDLKIDKSRTIKGLKNNKLLTASFNSISGNNLDIDILPLKNQLTSDGKTSKNNVFSSTEDAVTHRKYTNLFTGSNQQLGNDSVFLGYQTQTREIILLGDKLTYFHIPYDFAPYTQLSIHDSTFVDSGAVAGDKPVNSDKIFVRHTERFKNKLTPQSDGTWVCSWLSGDSNVNGNYVWVDRFYNPAMVTRSIALTSDLVDVVDDWSSTVEFLSAEDLSVFDVRSKLLLEPGTLYAYHHIGNSDAQRLIDKFSSDLYKKDVEVYRDANDTDISVTDGEYVFQSNQYGVIRDVHITGSFDINFWLQSEDWTKPFGNQIVGNFIDTGFGVINESIITPSFVIPDNKKVHVYNSDFVKLETHNLDKNINLFKKLPSAKGYYIVDDGWKVYEYDHNGVIRNRIDLSSRIAAGVLPTDIDIDDFSLYIATTSAVGNTSTVTDPISSNTDVHVLKYSLQNQDTNYKGEVIKVSSYLSSLASTHGGALTGFRIAAPSKTSHTLFGTDPMVVAVDYKSTTNGISSINNNLVIDNNGNPWFIANNRVFTYEPQLSATHADMTSIEALSSTDTIVGINVDKDNNVWVLYGWDKVAKFDSDRNLLLTTTLTSTPSSTNSRNIDFVYEFDKDGYSTNTIVFNESIDGGNVIRIDSTTGSEISAINLGIGLVTTGSVSSLSGAKSFNGLESNRRYNSKPYNSLEFKIAVTNQYNPSTTTAAYSAHTISYATSGLTDGYHNFHASFNAETGAYRLYVDSVESGSIQLQATKFSFLPVLDSDISIGSTPYLQNITLHDYLKQPGKHKASNIAIKGVRIYSSNLSYYDMKLHYRLHSNIEPVKFDIPTGNRNYLDEIERVFKFKIPGRKSEYFEVDIRNTGITDDGLKKDIANKIIEQLGNTTPVYSKLNKMSWDGTSIESGTLTGRGELITILKKESN